MHRVSAADLGFSLLLLLEFSSRTRSYSETLDKNKHAASSASAFKTVSEATRTDGADTRGNHARSWLQARANNNCMKVVGFIGGVRTPEIC